MSYRKSALMTRRCSVLCSSTTEVQNYYAWKEWTSYPFWSSPFWRLAKTVTSPSHSSNIQVPYRKYFVSPSVGLCRIDQAFQVRTAPMDTCKVEMKLWNFEALKLKQGLTRELDKRYRPSFFLNLIRVIQKYFRLLKHLQVKRLSVIVHLFGILFMIRVIRKYSRN